MSELARTIVGRLREFIGNRRDEKRCVVRLPFSVSVVDPSQSSNGARRPQSIDGHTRDISPTGMALLVSVIRIGTQYLADQDRRLQIKLELPSGPIELQAVPVRYERTEEMETGYVIGARIVQMNESDRARFNEYIVERLR
jgi:PilZ domain